MARRSHLFVALLAAVGCDHKHETAPAAPPTPAPAQRPAPAIAMTKQAPQAPVHVSWKLAREPAGKALKLDYEIENRTTAQIYVLDQLVTTSTPGYELLPDRVIVRGGPDGATASLFLGFMDPPPGVAVEVEPMPVARVVAAGAKLTGTKTVPLPVAAWHPYIQYMQPLAATPTKAILEISWLPDKLPEHVTAAWEDYPSASGGKLRLPTRAYVVNAQQLARGDTLEIP